MTWVLVYMLKLVASMCRVHVYAYTFMYVCHASPKEISLAPIHLWVCRQRHVCAFTGLMISFSISLSFIDLLAVLHFAVQVPLLKQADTCMYRYIRAFMRTMTQTARRCKNIVLVYLHVLCRRLQKPLDTSSCLNGF